MQMDANDKQINSRDQELLGDFLTQLLEQKRSHVDGPSATERDESAGQQVQDCQEGNRSDLENLEQLSDSYKNVTNLHLRRTSDLLDSLQSALHINAMKNVSNKGLCERNSENDHYFRVHVAIEEALYLSNKKKYKQRKGKKRSITYDDSLPSCYVTFEADPNLNLKITPIEFKTANPRWNFQCDVTLPTELLTDNQKRLIFKMWRKGNGPSVQPNLHNDVIIGFAELDLTVLVSGLPSVQGWFNITDSLGKCTGQIKITLTPSESIQGFINQGSTPCCSLPSPSPVLGSNLPYLLSSSNNKEETFSSEPGELLSNTLKRKFEELEEINQRLRSRLANVIEEDSDSNDEFSEAFEADINMLCVEDDFDTVDFNHMENQNKYEINSLLLRLDRQSQNGSTDCKREKSSLDVNAVSLLQKDACQMSVQMLMDTRHLENKSNECTGSNIVNSSCAKDSCSTSNLRGSSHNSDYPVKQLDSKQASVTPGSVLENESHVEQFDPLMFQKLCTVTSDSDSDLLMQTQTVDSSLRSGTD